MKKIILISICVLLLGWGCDDPNLLKANWPTIGSVTISDVTETTANCTFTFAPVAALVSKAGIQYSTSGSFAEGTREVTTSSLSNGNVYLQITGLVSNTTYYYKAFISNQQNETIYSTVNQFKTVEYPKLEVSTNSLNFSASREEKTLQITSNQAWEVKIDPPSTWLTLSKNSGSNTDEITVTAIANPGVTERKATIIVSGPLDKDGNPLYQEISVIQAGADSRLYVSRTQFSNLSYAGSQQTFYVLCNTNWSLSSNGDDWMNFSRRNGSGPYTDTTYVTVTVSANPKTTLREATIMIKCEGKEGSISVSQSGAPAKLLLSESSMTFSTEYQSRSITVESNVEWTVSSDKDWCTVSPTKGENNGQFSVIVAQNTTTSERTATITVSGGGITRRINVTQQYVAPSLEILPSSPLEFPAASASIERNFTINSNIAWTISQNSGGWLTVSPLSGSLVQNIKVTAAANTGSTSRNATITVTGGGIIRTVSVTQLGVVAPFLNVSPGSLTFPNYGNEQTLDISSNVSSWTATSDATAWLKVAPGSGSNDGKVTVSVIANTGAEREGNITVRGGSFTRTIHVTQAGNDPPYITVNRSNFPTFSAAGEEGVFTVSTNITVQINCSAAWFSVDQPTVSSQQNHPVKVTVLPNTTGSSRSGTISVSGNGATTRNISVMQSN